jgi:hypothetical protein
LFELKDLPRGLKLLGDALSGRRDSGALNPANHYLAYNFGWAPLFADLSRLLDLTNSIERRLDQLRKASRKKRIEGKLPSDTLAWHGSTKRQTLGSAYLNWKPHYTYKEENWFTTGFDPDLDQLPSPDSSYQSRARWALGLNGSASTIWNAIPWSWLIDYFFTVGTYLEANRGLYRSIAHDMCIMSKGTLTLKPERVSYSSRWKSGPDLSGGYEIEHLRRRVYPLPEARIAFAPFLTGHQTSILIALSLSKPSTHLKKFSN